MQGRLIHVRDLCREKIKARTQLFILLWCIGIASSHGFEPITQSINAPPQFA